MLLAFLNGRIRLLRPAGRGVVAHQVHALALLHDAGAQVAALAAAVLFQQEVLLALDRHVDEEVCRVDVLRAREASSLEVLHTLAGRPEVGHASLRQHHQLVEEVEDSTARLVDRADDGAALLAQVVQCLQDTVGVVGIEAGRRLVEEDDTWVRDEAAADREPLLLSSRDASPELGADPGVPDLGEAQHLNELLHPLLSLLGADRGGKLEVCVELQCFSHGEQALKAVVLRHVARESIESLVRLAAVHADVSSNVARVLPLSKHIKQRTLAGASCTDDCEKLPRPHRARHVLEDCLWLLLECEA
mmetsp:Transcript_10838/g.44376  ORF Transcript_10838/g.44376 Transcript_10838/m.44376 type:complete len:304 (-) Transcript_10838:154-1065(-)